MYKEYVAWFMEQEFYREWLVDFPEPFNNPAFASALALAAVCMGIITVVGDIRSFLFHSRIRKKNRQLENLRLEQEIKEAQKAQVMSSQTDLLGQYMNFMMMVQRQNMTSLKGLTFEQWQVQAGKYGEGLPAERPVQVVTVEVPKTEPVRVKKEESAVMEIAQETVMDIVGEDVRTEVQDMQDENMGEILLEDLPEDIPVDITAYGECLDDAVICFTEPVELPEEVKEAEKVKEQEEPEQEVLLKKEPEPDLIPKKLTEEQVSDFEKLVSMMEASRKQQEQLRNYKEKKSAVVKNNMELLNSQLESGIRELGKQEVPEKAQEDSLNRKKAEALAKMEAEKKQSKTGRKKQKI